METRQVIVGGVVVLLLLAVAIAAAWWGVAFVVDRFSHVDPTAGTVGVMGAVSLLLAAWIVARGIVRAKADEVQDRLCEERAELYERVLSWCFSPAAGAHSRDNEGRAMEDFDVELMLKAGPRVVARYFDLVAAISENRGMDPLLRQRLILEMRSELGVENSRFPLTDLQ